MPAQQVITRSSTVNVNCGVPCGTPRAPGRHPERVIDRAFVECARSRSSRVPCVAGSCTPGRTSRGRGRALAPPATHNAAPMTYVTASMHHMMGVGCRRVASRSVCMHAAVSAASTSSPCCRCVRGATSRARCVSSNASPRCGAVCDSDLEARLIRLFNSFNCCGALRRVPRMRMARFEPTRHMEGLVHHSCVRDAGLGGMRFLQFIQGGERWLTIR